MSDALKPMPMTDDEVRGFVDRTRKAMAESEARRIANIQNQRCRTCRGRGHNTKTCDVAKRMRKGGN